jgi:hypothetical protein
VCHFSIRSGVMENASRSSKQPVWDWPSWMKGSVPNPIDIFATPQNLAQSILPGWVIGGVVNVTDQNSSAPDTERAVVAAHSYGRQLGRVIDALAVLIADLPKEKQDDLALNDLMTLHREIDDIKSQSAERRLNRVVLDLAILKKTNPDEYAGIAEKLRDALKVT